MGYYLLLVVLVVVLQDNHHPWDVVVVVLVVNTNSNKVSSYENSHPFPYPPPSYPTITTTTTKNRRTSPPYPNLQPNSFPAATTNSNPTTPPPWVAVAVVEEFHSRLHPLPHHHLVLPFVIRRYHHPMYVLNSIRSRVLVLVLMRWRMVLWVLVLGMVFVEIR